MIKIGNNIWRTLDQPIYVNGRRVLEVYADDQLVYPDRFGDLIKFKGHVEFNETIHVSNSAIAFDTYTIIDDYDVTLSGSASFVCVYEALPRYVGQNIRIFKDGQERVMTHYQTVGTKVGMQAFLDESREFWDVIYLPDRSDVYATTNAFHTEIDEDFPPYYTGNIKIMYKQNISPFRLPGRVREAHWYYGSPDTGYSWTIIDDDPYAWMINEHNKIYHFEENRASVQNGWGKTVYENSSKIYFRLNGKRLNARMNFNENNPREYRITDIKYYDTPQPDMTGYLTTDMDYFEVGIPIDEILYLGNKVEAPEWAKNVYESDLE